MKLDEFYTVESDASCWVLTFEKKGPETNDKGELITSRNTSYHANLKQALLKYLDNALKPCGTVQAVVNRIAEVESMIAKDVITVTWEQVVETYAEATKEAMRNRKATGAK